MLSGAVKNKNADESIFLIESAIINYVMAIKLFYLMWKKNRIVEFLNRIRVVSTDDRKEFSFINDKLNNFMNIATAFFIFETLCSASACIVVPFIGSEKKLFVKIGFPLDYEHDELSFWIAFTFFLINGTLCVLSMFFSIIKWYLLINCGLMYHVLGNQFRQMGAIKAIDQPTEKEKQSLFLRDFIAGIQSHRHIKE